MLTHNMVLLSLYLCLSMPVLKVLKILVLIIVLLGAILVAPWSLKMLGMYLLRVKLDCLRSDKLGIRIRIIRDWVREVRLCRLGLISIFLVLILGNKYLGVIVLQLLLAMLTRILSHIPIRHFLFEVITLPRPTKRYIVLDSRIIWAIFLLIFKLHRHKLLLFKLLKLNLLVIELLILKF